MKQLICAIDIGTTSMRGILFDETGQVQGMHAVTTPLVFRGPYIEQSPQTLDDALTDIFRHLLPYGQPDAVTLTAFRSAPTLVDETGEALCNFIMWQDTRNRDICARLEKDNPLIRARTGAKVNAVFTASKITWLKENEPELFAKAYKAMIVPDYLMCRMTGAFHTDYTYGSRTSLMDIRTCTWDEEMCGLFSLTPEIMSDLIPQGAVYGHVTKDYAARSGLRLGIPVISAGGDQQCGALGLGALDDTSLIINCGTGSFVIGLCDHAEDHEMNRIVNVAAVREKYIIESNILSSAAALNWGIRTMFPEIWRDEATDYAAFNALAASSPAGANGVVCVPLFQGCGTRDWNPDARASFSGLTLSSSRADIARALYEGIAAEIVKSIRALPGTLAAAPCAYLGGGMTKSDLFDAVLADMSGKTLTRYDDAQATAYGALISALVTLKIAPDERTAFERVRGRAAVKTFTPDPATSELYQNYIDRTEAVYHALS